MVLSTRAAGGLARSYVWCLVAGGHCHCGSVGTPATAEGRQLRCSGTVAQSGDRPQHKSSGPVVSELGDGALYVAGAPGTEPVETAGVMAVVGATVAVGAEGNDPARVVGTSVGAPTDVMRFQEWPT